MPLLLHLLDELLRDLQLVLFVHVLAGLLQHLVLGTVRFEVAVEPVVMVLSPFGLALYYRK